MSPKANLIGMGDELTLTPAGGLVAEARLFPNPRRRRRTSCLQAKLEPRRLAEETHCLRPASCLIQTGAWWSLKISKAERSL